MADRQEQSKDKPATRRTEDRPVEKPTKPGTEVKPGKPKPEGDGKPDTGGGGNDNGGGGNDPTDVALREHLLNRFGYGGSPASRASYDNLGPAAWLAQQITDAGTLDMDDWAWPASPRDLQGSGNKELARTRTVGEMLKRSVADEPSLAAVLRDHWFNHFNVYGFMGVAKHQLDDYLNAAIVPQIVDSFEAMLFETAKHPAMLHYLDNQKNHKVNYIATPEADLTFKDVPVGPNQNYAREVLELHTVGDGNHSQADVLAATRLLSGFSSDFLASNLRQYKWRPTWHDNDPKLFFEGTGPTTETLINGNGQAELRQFTEMLAAHPATAQRVAAKLAQRFIGPLASPETVDAIASSFATTATGDLAAAMQAVAASAQFTQAGTFKSKFKPPHRFIASAYRSVGAEPNEATREELAADIVLLGDAPFFYGPPTGYPDTDALWLTGDGMLARAQIAQKISQDNTFTAALGMPASPSAAGIADHVVNTILPAGVSFKTLDVITREVADQSGPGARLQRCIELTLCSPEFLRY